ncbi:MAG: GNAT family N-acetyltransferase [Candidatus Berkelbacteria bacterium]
MAATDEILIREYENADYDAFLQIIEEFQRYIAKTDSRGVCCDFRSLEDVKKYADQSLRDVAEREGAIYFAEIDDKIAGFILGIVERNEKDTLYILTHKPGAHGWIGEVFVSPEFRKQGIARKLIDKITADFKTKGCVNVRLYVMADNKLAISAYENLGFQTRDLEMSKDI